MHVCVCQVASVVSDSVILWTVACQAPLSMGFSRQEYWSRWSCPPPRDLPDPGMEPASLMSPALAGRFFTTSATWEVPKIRIQGSKKKSENTSCHFLLHRRKRPSTRCLASQRAWNNGGLHAEPPGRTLNAPLRPNFFTFLSLRPSGRRALSTPSPPILQDTAHSCFPPRTPSAIPPTPCPASESFSGT